MPPLPKRPWPKSRTKYAFEQLDSVCNENKAVNEHSFIPTSLFNSLFTKELIHDVMEEIPLPIADVEGEVDANSTVTPISVQHVYDSYRKVLAILIMLRKEEFLYDFVHHGCSDKSLPLEKDGLDAIDVDGGLAKSTFVTKQYLFLSEPFVRDGEYTWTSEIVLPILKEEPLRSGRGGFGTVHKITIHKDYDMLADESDANKEHIYARKALSPIPDRHILEQDYHYEVDACKRLRQHRNPSIIPLLAHYKHGPRFNLLFPFCECNLKDFFDDQLPNNFQCGDAEVDKLRFLEKIARLASGLATIHYSEEKSGTEVIKQQFGYHRDLKPQNILKKDKRFMIADFGLTRFSQSDTEHTGYVWQYGTGTYRAPECSQSDKKIGRRADVWAFGCILAEALAYAVKGPDGVREFRRRRTRKATGDMFENDWFHHRTKVRQEVVDYLHELCRFKGSVDEVVHDFVGLIKKTLERNPKHRPVADIVSIELYRILEKEARKLSVKLELEKPDNYSKRLEIAQKTRGYLSRAASAIEDMTRGVSRLSRGPSRLSRSDTGFSSIKSDSSALEVPSRRDSTVPKDDPLKILDRMDTMFLIDDSCTTHWDKIRRSLSIFAREGTKHDPDGVDIAFVNSKEEAHSLASEAAVMKVFDSVKQTRDSFELSLSHRLDQILSTYVNKYKSEEDRLSTSPLNLIVVTSGELGITGFEELQNTIMSWARVMDNDNAPIHQLGIQFVLVGSKQEAKKQFHHLDEEEYKKQQVRDIVDHTRFDPDIAAEDESVLCKIMCGGVVKAWDVREVNGSVPQSPIWNSHR